MRFEYTGRHIEVTPALRSHVEDHFDRLDHLFNGNSAKAHVIIGVERGRHRSEIIVNWRRDVLTATTTNTDMYQSLSQSITKIENIRPPRSVKLQHAARSFRPNLPRSV